jgi:hypothetical protein
VFDIFASVAPFLINQLAAEVASSNLLCPQRLSKGHANASQLLVGPLDFSVTV